MGRVNLIVSRWFGHMESMYEYQMDRKVSVAEVSGGQVWGRLKLDWMDGIKVDLRSRGMMAEAARQCIKDRKVGEILFICR